MEYSKLDAFLDHWPQSQNDCDRRRFLEYALEASAESRGFARQRFEACGKLTKEEIDEYESLYSWIRLLYEMLAERGVIL